MNVISRTLAVGVTGGIGSGKTEVCKIFAALGAKTLSADDIAKEIVASDPGIRKKIANEFGPKSFLEDGTLDRKQMAARVFSDPKLKERLEAILHPPTLKKIENEIRSEKKSNRYPLVVVEAALLFESGADRMLDYVIVVDTPEETAIKRVMKRDATSDAEVRRRIQSQMPVVEKSDKADFVIHNSGDFKLLERNCKFLFSLLATLRLTEDKS